VKLEEIIADALGIPLESVHETLTVEDVQSWDSLAHVGLVIRLEAAYGVSFQPSEIERMYKSVGDIRDVLRRKGVNV